MRLLLREHIPLTLMYITQLFLMMLIFWLNGSRGLNSMGYAVFLSSCIFILYIIYRYVSHRSFYKRLTAPLETLDESLKEQSDVPMTEALHTLLRSQYQLYQQELRQYETLVQNRITFMNQWVHQMKTPLSVIHLTIQDEDDPIFDSIREELDRMSAGLETVLYSSRLDRFEQDFVVEPIQLHKLVNDLVSAQRRLFIRNRIHPIIEVDPKWVIASDEKWLSFAIGQLMTNAVRYSSAPRKPKGTQPETGSLTAEPFSTELDERLPELAEPLSQTVKKVKIAVYLRGKNVVLEIADEGAGIPLHDQKRVFEAYFTGDNGRIFQESTGMGLYLVREVCTRLGHRVELESEAGAGTQVRIIFHEPIDY